MGTGGGRAVRAARGGAQETGTTAGKGGGEEIAQNYAGPGPARAGSWPKAVSWASVHVGKLDGIGRGGEVFRPGSGGCGKTDRIGMRLGKERAKNRQRKRHRQRG